MTANETFALRPVVVIAAAGPRGFRVSTFPQVGDIDRTFDGLRAFEDAIKLAINAAAGLGCEMVDRTGRLSAEQCAALVAERAGGGGAAIVPLASRRG